ncbi:MAG: 1,4-dihydroxy-2-naphthoate polyprenyltransferase [Anaerolineales bacterium]|nr:1,4-dihydroxy-2-naphthoate polyprenyltransferase [Anaerolineales bacterium]
MSDQDSISPTQRQAWLLAVRPKTLPAAAAGVVTGTALAWKDGQFHWLPALVALGVALLLQIGSNLANDVFDYERGADRVRQYGPLRVTQAGLLTPGQVKRGMLVVFGLAAVLGAGMFFVAGWPVLVIGAAAILAALVYTGGPFPIGYYGLGDLFVFLFFGAAAVAGTYYVQALGVSPAAWWMSLPVGLLITNILIVNNLRDIENDRAVNKRTMAVLLGVRLTRIEYLVFLVVSYSILPLLAVAGILPWWALLAWVSLPFGQRVTRMVFTASGRPLNAALAMSGQLALAYSLLFAAGMLLSGWLPAGVSG